MHLPDEADDDSGNPYLVEKYGDELPVMLNIHRYRLGRMGGCHW